jgi:tol-pal system beta propeller repeat protein TolB
MFKKKYYIIIIILYIFTISNLWANLAININGGTDKIALSVSEIEANNLSNLNLAYEIEALIRSQLESSKIFKIYNEFENSKKNFSFLENLLNKFKQHIITDKLSLYLSTNLDNSLKIEFFITAPIKEDIIINLVDNQELAAINKAPILAKKLIYSREKFTKDEWHKVAAEISDLIFQKYTGISGYINSSIAYVAEKHHGKKRKYYIARMSLSGLDHHYLTDGKNIVLSPKISPDGKKILYLEFLESQPASLYLLDIATKVKERIIDFPAMLYAPNFSPDGKKIVMSASYEGNSEIAIFDFETRQLKRITYNYAIDTSPDFSPDGQKIVFSSDRTGSQKLYIMDIDGTNLKRINFSAGSYSDPAWSPDGKYIAFTKIYQNKFHIGIVNLTNNKSYILTNGYKDEAPNWSANSKFLIFTRYQKAKYRAKKRISKLFLINLNGMMMGKIDTPSNASDANWRFNK